MVPVARKGDQVICPRCPPHLFVIAEGLENCTDQDLPMAVEGHLTSCGARLIAALATANELAAARAVAFASEYSHDEQIVAKGSNGQPLAGLAYFIQSEKGAVLFGYTDDEGTCPRIGTDGPEDLSVWFGAIAHQKQKEQVK